MKDVITAAFSLYKDGHSIRDIAQMLNLGKSTVQRYLKMNEIEGCDLISTKDISTVVNKIQRIQRSQKLPDIPENCIRKKMSQIYTKYINIYNKALDMLDECDDVKVLIIGLEKLNPVKFKPSNLHFEDLKRLMEDKEVEESDIQESYKVIVELPHNNRDDREAVRKMQDE